MRPPRMPSGSTPATVHRLRDDGVVVIGEEEHEATCRRRGEATQALEVAATTAYISPRRVPQPRVHGFLVATMASPHRTKSNQSIERRPGLSERARGGRRTRRHLLLVEEEGCLRLRMRRRRGGRRGEGGGEKGGLAAALQSNEQRVAGNRKRGRRFIVGSDVDPAIIINLGVEFNCILRTCEIFGNYQFRMTRYSRGKSTFQC